MQYIRIDAVAVAPAFQRLHSPKSAKPYMRITPEQIRTILATVGEQAGSGARVVLFGSRVSDSGRGGDIDLLIESRTPPNLWQRARIKLLLEDALQIPVDIVAKQMDTKPKPFQAIALITGLLLGTTP